MDAIAPTNAGKRTCGDEGKEAAGKADFFSKLPFTAADDRTVKWRAAQPTGAAERNKGNNRRETA